MGMRVHGKDATKAAKRRLRRDPPPSSASSDARQDRQDMFVDVTIAVPDQAGRYCALPELLYGTITVTAVKGGLEILPKPAATLS